MADVIATLQQQRRQLAELTTVNKIQQTDIESLKKRLQRSVAENDDLLEKLAEMKRDRWQRDRQFDEQMKDVADKLRQLEDNPHPNSDRMREAEERMEEGCRNVDRIQRELDAERRRYAELERKHEELQLRLERVQLQHTQSLRTPETVDVQVQVNDTQREQQLGDQVHFLTTELAAARKRLIDEAASSSQVKRLVREKAEIEEKNSKLSSAMDHLKRNNAVSEEQEGMLRIQLDKLKRTLDACGITDDDLEKQLQRIVDKNLELEQQLKQMRTEHSDAKRTEKTLRIELEKMKQAEDERTVRETDLERQIAKAHEDCNILRRQTLSEIDRLEEESKKMNEEVDELRKVNMQLANNERQLKTELKEVKMEANENVRRILQTREEAYIKLRKESDELLEKKVSKERLEEVETELKQVRNAAEETEIRIQKLRNEQYALQEKAEGTERELNEELEKLRSELTTKEKQLQKAAENLLELKAKHDKLKQSYNTKEKLFKSRHEQLERTAKEHHDAFQEKIKTQDAKHLAEKEHMLSMWNEKEKELKNKIKISKLEIRAEVNKVKSKCEQLETAHEEKMKQKEEETKCRMNKLIEEVEQRNRLMQEANEKNKELQEIVDNHVSETSEVETLRSANNDLKDNVGKLERAVLRLRLENDELRENKLYKSNDENIRQLVGEQTVHISDLQLQVDMLRRALKDPSKPSSRFSVPPVDATRSVGVDRHGRLLAEMQQLLKTSAKASNQPVEDSSTLARELESERRKVRAGSERIAQLEGWLDTIFNDQQFGIGPSAVRGGTEQTSKITLPPVDGVSTVPAGDNSKTHTTSRHSNQTPNKQKQTRTSRSKRK